MRNTLFEIEKNNWQSFIFHIKFMPLGLQMTANLTYNILVTEKVVIMSYIIR